MSGRSPHSAANLDPLIAAEGALWSERLREGVDPSAQAAFEEWIRKDARHREAYQRAETAWRTARAAADDPRMLSLRNQALSRAASRGWRDRLPRFGRIAAVVAALVLVSVSVGLLLSTASPVWRSGRPVELASTPDYRTEIGQRLTAPLPDGSMMTLNTASRASVSYSATERVITLGEGQAFFDVVHDPERPFSVIAGGRRITAVGTAFDVYLAEEQVTVTTVEGSVVVDLDEAGDAAPTASDPAASRRVAAGEQLVHDAANPDGLVRSVDARRLTSWLNGQLIFEGDTLDRAVAEMNRYATRRIIIVDPEIGRLPLSGAFGAGQSTAFAEALAAYFPEVEAQVSDTAIVLRRVD